MADFIRRLVSGPKARFQDDELGLDLDLVYVTDQIIIMGYPAVGLEGLYRNRREDAKKFLDHRHGKNYWVFNFCPIKENSYDAAVFEGRVTRFPFPDHHAPPLALMPLVAREMHDWLDQSPEHVAVLHCKAGKGRSGTMACTYLLTLTSAPSGPSLDANLSAKDRAIRKTQQTIDELPEDEDVASPVSPVIPAHSKPILPLNKYKSPPDIDYDDDTRTSPPQLDSPLQTTANPERSFTDTLKGVLDLHTARRMKPTQTRKSTDGKKQRQGVSIPSQQRWLYYWALILAGDAPPHVLNYPSSDGGASPHRRPDTPRVRITRIQVRLRESSGMARKLVHATNVVLDKAERIRNNSVSNESASPDPSRSSSVSPGVSSPNDNDPNKLWVSVARYDDALIDILERWEAWTRREGAGEGVIFKRRPDSKTMVVGEIRHQLDELFDARGVWDEGKMVRSFAKFGLRSSKDRSVTLDDANGHKSKINAHTLRLLNDNRWHGSDVKSHQPAPPRRSGTEPPNQERQIKDLEKNMKNFDIPISEATSVFEEPVDQTGSSGDAGRTAEELAGLVVDASRELRVKLYVGKVFIGWFWFIPAFHMPQPPSTTSEDSKSTATFHLDRKDLDFALGLGSSIVDVDVDMEWVAPSLNGVDASSSRLDGTFPVQAGDRADSVEDKGVVAAILQAASQGGEGVRDALKVGQASGV